MTEKTPIIRVVGAAILRAGRCLVTQRGDGGDAARRWEFPGGKVEPGETPTAALAREIREELALEVEVGPRLGRGRHHGPAGVVELEIYAARVVGGTFELREHRTCGWFSADEIDALDWAEADRPVLPAVKKALDD